MGGLKRSLAWFAMALVAMTVTACGDAGKSDAAKGGQSVRLSIATGGVSGVYYVYGGAYAAAISKAIPGYVATAEVTAASVDNLRKRDSGEVGNLMRMIEDVVAERLTRPDSRWQVHPAIAHGQPRFLHLQPALL